MDVVLLSRMQFAVATMFHFIFVPLTLGLAFIIAMMETRYARTGDKLYLKMTKFWGKMFLINFALGVVTGISLEFQFGTNWSKYSAYVGDIFGSLLAIEATVGFFLESTLIGVWIFGWKRISAKAHATVMWLISGAGIFSAIWILLANGWMQHPVGYEIRNGRAELADFMAILTNKFGLLQIFHTLSGAFTLTGFLIMGISAWHLLKKDKKDHKFFKISFQYGMVFGLVFSLTSALGGDFHAKNLVDKQPAKLAAMEAHWETTERAPLYLFAIPSEEEEKNLIQIAPIPGALSFLGTGDFNAKITGLRDIPKDERPPVMITFVSFRLMVAFGTLLIALSIWALVRRKKLVESPLLLKILVWSIPIPYITIQLGWIVAEVGRQPWIVYGLLKTSDAVSPVAGEQVLGSLIGFFLVYAFLGALGFFLAFKHAKAGPEAIEA